MVGQDMLLSCSPSDVCFWEGGGPSGLLHLIGTKGASLEGEENRPKGEVGCTNTPLCRMPDMKWRKKSNRSGTCRGTRMD